MTGSLVDGADYGESDDSKDGTSDVDGSFDSSTDSKDDFLKNAHNYGCEEGSVEAFIGGMIDEFNKLSADGFIDDLDNSSTLVVGLFDLN